MLTHPLRFFARRLFAGHPLDVERLNSTQDAIIAAGPIGAGAAASLALGAGEGVKLRVRGLAVKGPRKGAGTIAHVQFLNEKLQRSKRRTTSYLAVSGLLKVPDRKTLEQKIDLVVAHAKSNKDRILAADDKRVRNFPSLDHFTTMAAELVGINKGADTISEVRVVEYDPKKKDQREVDIHCFDARGNHVMWAELEKYQPGVLYVASLRATHGRNVEDLGLDFGGSKVPGRGNGALTAAGLEAIIIEGARRGLYALATRAGSPMVARLYEKMGFTEPGAQEPYERKRLEWALENLPIAAEILDVVTIARKQLRAARQAAHGEDPSTLMILDLTNPNAVRQALSAFAHSRASIDDVPKDVAQRLKQRGEEASPPNRDEWIQELHEDCPNVRVLRR